MGSRKARKVHLRLLVSFQIVRQVVEQGQIIERGDHAGLLAQHGKYYQLYTGAAELS